MNPEFSDGALGDGLPSDFAENGTGFGGNRQEQQPYRTQPQQKKLARRRHHASRPCQEQLLSMAEARREIVAALKFHRAAMKRAGEQQQQQQQQKQLQQEAQPSLGVQQRERSTISDARDHLSNTTPNSMPFSENLNHIFPSKPLGLNLNFHDFIKMHTTLHSHDDGNPKIHHPFSSCSYSHSSLVTTNSAPEAVPISGRHPPASEETSETPSDEDMAGLCSIGEQHKTDWNGHLNLAASSWRCKFMDTIEMSPLVLETGNGRGGIGGDVLHIFDGVLDIPAWLGDQEHLDDHYSEEYFHDMALPCLDIGELESMDCEWLS
uniref:Uncharacterized protein n=1 Tax=Anthurium amnicola TaxID=1678845 RepID=A0A1D1XFB0_9ARAE